MSARRGLPLWLAAAAACILWATDPLVLGAWPHAATLAVLAGLALVRGGTLARVVRLVGVETTKLLANRVFVFGLGATAAITLLAGLVHEPLDGETGWALAAGSLGTGLWCAEVFVLVLGATAIAGEQAQGTLKMILPHAYERAEWVAAKGLVLAAAAAVLAVLAAGVAAAHAALALGLGDVVKEIPAGFGETEGSVEVFQSAAVMRSHLLDVALAGLVSLVTTAMLGLFFSTVFDGVVAALSASFLLFLGLESADVLLGLPREVLQNIYAAYPDQLGEWTEKLGRGLNETWDPAYLDAGIALATLTGVSAWLLAVLRFDRRDLQA